MDYKSLLGFLLNNNLLSPNEIYKDPFSLEKREESNILFYVNARVDKSVNKFVIKTLKNPSISNSLLLRESLLFSFFATYPSISPFKLNSSPRPYNSNGLYLNNSVFVREYIDEYTDAFRYLKNIKEVDSNIELKDFNQKIISKIAQILATFNNCLHEEETIIDYSADILTKSEIKIDPIFFKEIPPLTKFKFSPSHIQQFWKIINQEKKTIECWLNYIRVNRNPTKLIHGDFRLKNIMFNIVPWKDEIEHFLIDYEQWHIGDIAWDIATFFNTIPEDIDFDMESFYQTYLCKFNSLTREKILDEDIEVLKTKVKYTQWIISIQNSYFILKESGGDNRIVKEEIDLISKILKTDVHNII